MLAATTTAYTLPSSGGECPKRHTNGSDVDEEPVGNLASVDDLIGLPQLDVAREERQARYYRSMGFSRKVVSSGGGGFSGSVSVFNGKADLPAMNSTESLDDDSGGGGVERQVLQSNPVLASFGNAHAAERQLLLVRQVRRRPLLLLRLSCRG